MDINPNRNIMLEKLIINIGIGQNEQLYDNAKALLKKLTGHEAAPTKAKSRDPSLKLKKGQIIGAMVTLRKNEASTMLEKAINAVGKLKESSIKDNMLNFGIKEYIDFSGVKYDPKIGMFGMNVNAVFSRKGKRVETRKRKRGKASKEHMVVKKEDIIEYIKSKFGNNIIE
ncbi:MAG: 50S ribosomal protein L5 [Candidatus Micrarchaeia archaeon]